MEGNTQPTNYSFKEKVELETLNNLNFEVDCNNIQIELYLPQFFVHKFSLRIQSGVWKTLLAYV